MTDVLWGAAVFAWAMAALFIQVPEQPIPMFGDTYGEFDEWRERCHIFHDSAQRGLRKTYGTLAAAAALAAVVGGFLHLGVQYAAAFLLLALTTVAAGIPAARWWERVQRARLQERPDLLGQPPSL